MISGCVWFLVRALIFGHRSAHRLFVKVKLSSSGEISTVFYDPDIIPRSSLIMAIVMSPTEAICDVCANLSLSWGCQYQEAASVIAPCKRRPPCYCLACVEAPGTKVFDLSCLFQVSQQGDARNSFCLWLSCSVSWSGRCLAPTSSSRLTVGSVWTSLIWICFWNCFICFDYRYLWGLWFALWLNKLCCSVATVIRLVFLSYMTGLHRINRVAVCRKVACFHQCC